MSKQLIIYMLQKIIYKQEIIELKKVMKEIILFFVLQLQEMVLLFKENVKTLKYSRLNIFWIEFQFFVSDSSFSVLAPTSVIFNSLYPAPNSLKN